jgi:Fe-S oxidoreductase
MKKYIEEIEKCIDCKICDDLCPTYKNTGNELEIPRNRLKIAEKVFKGEKITEEEFNSIYSCTKCEACDKYCSSEIKISRIIGKAREELFKQGYDLLPGHQGLRNGILERKNSTKGDPEHLLDYLPEGFVNNPDATRLYYAGCLSGYFLKSIGTSSVKILDKIGDPFKVIKDEICCGSPLVDLGDIENARKFFEENLEIFKKNNVESLIVSCSGCYRSFVEFYPEILGRTIAIKHIVDVIDEAIDKGKIKFKKTDKRVIYHDPCHLGREFQIYDSPRNVLEAALKDKLVEFNRTRDETDCCGADSAVRAGFKNLAVKVALQRVNEAVEKADILVTACPFCVFNLNYAVRKNEKPIKVQFITEFLEDLIVK